MKKDFWSESKVVVLGGGAWGTMLSHLVSFNVREVCVYMRDEEMARSVNAHRKNLEYAPQLSLQRNIRAISELDRVFDGKPSAIIWALPSAVCRTEAKKIAQWIRGDEVILHATKGIELETLQTTSEVLLQEFPTRRVGVISGPNLAQEIERGEPAATVIASAFPEVIDAGIKLFTSKHLRVYGSKDVVGVEWAGALKNILAIAAGAVEELGFGWNTKSMLYTRGISEMSRFAEIFGADSRTFMGLAGMGDTIATCSSPTSRNFRVGRALAQGRKLEEFLEELGSTAEGVRTARAVGAYARRQELYMPITEGVNLLLDGRIGAKEAIAALMVTRAENLYEY